MNKFQGLSGNGPAQNLGNLDVNSRLYTENFNRTAPFVFPISP